MLIKLNNVLRLVWLKIIYSACVSWSIVFVLCWQQATVCVMWDGCVSLNIFWHILQRFDLILKLHYTCNRLCHEFSLQICACVRSHLSETLCFLYQLCFFGWDQWCHHRTSWWFKEQQWRGGGRACDVTLDGAPGGRATEGQPRRCGGRAQGLLLWRILLGWRLRDLEADRRSRL